LVAVLVMAILAVVVVVGILVARKSGFRAEMTGPGGMGAKVEGGGSDEDAGPRGDAEVTDSKAGGSITARAPGSATVSGSEAEGDITSDATGEGDPPKAP
jgi:hypothetical protein